MHKKSQNWFAFSTDENSETLETSAIKDGRSIFCNVPSSPVCGRRLRYCNIEVGFSAIVV